MLQPQRVPHLVRGELPRPRQHHRLHLLGNRLAVRIRRKQRLGNHVVLPCAQAAQRHLSLDDLARPRIGHRLAVTPPARRTVYPLDHVVADVHRVRALRQHLHLPRILESRRLKRRRPPPRALHQRCANRLRRPAIHVVNQRLNRLAHFRIGILLDQPVPRNQSLIQRLAQRR